MRQCHFLLLDTLLQKYLNLRNYDFQFSNTILTQIYFNFLKKKKSLKFKIIRYTVLLETIFYFFTKLLSVKMFQIFCIKICIRV